MSPSTPSSLSSPYAAFHKQLGDLVLLEPALRKVAAHHGAQVRLLTRSGHEPLVRLMACARFQRGVPLFPAPALYAFDPLSKTALRSAFAPAWKKICVLPEKREYRPFLRAVYRRILIPELGAEYISEYFWRNTPVPPAEAFSPPKLELPPATWRPSFLPDRPFALINPSAGWRKKNWVPASWAALARHFSTRGFAVIATSGSTDWQRAETAALRELCPDILVPPQTALEEFLWLCANARAVATVDGSAAHLASAFGVPSLALFGPTEIAHWHRPSHLTRALVAKMGADGKRRLKNLPPEDAVSALDRLLEETQ